MKLKFIAVLVFSFSSMSMAKDSYDLNQAGYFVDICSSKSTEAICSAYLAGYRKGVNDLAAQADKASQIIDDKCDKDGSFCKLPPGGMALSSFEGCNLQAMKLSNATVKNMLLDYLRKNPAAMKSQLVDAYTEAMWQVFPCD